ncbi:speckle-type POZ protein [Trichonephila clavipes]|nr:speckle-type POZ protein [Trichonephila clavipes]
MANWSIRERKCFSFTWAIENFSFCWQKSNEEILSPPFIADTIERSRWKLMLFPEGEILHEKDSISFLLKREEDSKGPTDLPIFVELSFLTANGSVMSSEIFEYSFHEKRITSIPKTTISSERHSNYSLQHVEEIWTNHRG